MPRLKLVIAYDGHPFSGWQSQAGGNTVQDFLQQAFEKVCGEKLVVHGAGRTDAGVHALAQCAHVDVPPQKIDWRAALNAHLPRTIRVMRWAQARVDFHARFSATGKVYRYRICRAPVLPPLELHRAWHFSSELDLDAMQHGAKHFLGSHDFAAFAANRGKPVRSTIRTIHSLEIRSRGTEITLTFSGDGFLYKMVRLMTGALVRVAQHRHEPEWITTLLAGETKCTFAAPADGLYLVRVLY